MLKWYAIPLLAIVLYIYAVEMRKARQSRNWDPVIAGLTLFGMDFFNETWNGWVLNISGRSAFWTTPGDTALRTMVGWNIEIMFMFAIAGIVFYYMCAEDRRERVLGLPSRWFWAIAFSVFCVLVECVLNIGGLLVWEYPFWRRSFPGDLADIPVRLFRVFRGDQPCPWARHNAQEGIRRQHHLRGADSHEPHRHGPPRLEVLTR